MEDITHTLPDVIARWIDAHNHAERDTFIATFASDALLNDAKREFVGRDAIRAWADKEVFGDHLTMQVEKAYRHRAGIVVHARVDGDFDKSNLPDPLILSYYFSVDGGEITQLVVVLNKSVWHK
ncbi:nuclear transport factor 2 family protein [Paraburkholderia sp. DHOC27]|uniref:nuclear transport factor 2 family protein n=1 Tax=Paraburkholderia sp. DHOC27 TaxID=2303330 RepID=UPI000E3E62BB|nr:nuclear transport factor 2 family protein [Paraburkholderia sp. DHOC27]RFU45459.1 nuclear transport factor 2 family protein [Paraburkholderia sp. DHOC27]